MKPIEGVKLKDILAATTAAHKDAMTAKVRERIEHLLGERRYTQHSISALEAQLGKAKERLGQLEERLKKIEAGEWGVLPDEPLPKVTIGGKQDAGQGAERPSGVSYEEGM